MTTKIKKIFLNGLITLLPLAVTIYILITGISLIENILGKFIRDILPEGFYFPGYGFIATLLLVFIFGLLVNNLITATIIKKLQEKADRVLIDAPCSGLGVLKRNPDSKWKLQPEFIDNIRKVQAEILESYARMVKPGGKLVYATCSVLPSENQEQIKQFLTTENGKKFTFVQDSKILASESGFDGFYMALLERKNN